VWLLLQLVRQCVSWLCLLHNTISLTTLLRRRKKSIILLQMESISTCDSSNYGECLPVSPSDTQDIPATWVGSTGASLLKLCCWILCVPRPLPMSLGTSSRKGFLMRRIPSSNTLARSTKTTRSEYLRSSLWSHNTLSSYILCMRMHPPPLYPHIPQ